jgi:hypothetical protein
MKLEEALNLYVDNFQENFPIFSYNNLTDDEIVGVIKNSLETNERIKEEYLEDAIY